MMAKRDKWGVFMQVLCLGLAFFMLFPILYAVSVSLMEQKAVLASPPHFLPPKVTFDNYVTAYTRTTLPRYMGKFLCGCCDLQCEPRTGSLHVRLCLFFYGI